ncbi:IS66 family transposase [Pararhodospirillum photometricum]|uniref:IS66 family transposase n=1 Tax=Pararhodospirillum photometricum TaxID=1084 RepID=UPI0005A01DD4|nr:IS66 family transposase [Pararhodospirillum photometricum]
MSDAEKDALITDQAALIERLAARVEELEALVGKPRKTSSNSHLPPSKDSSGRKGGDKKPPKKSGKTRSSRPGVARPLTETPDKTERRIVEVCPHCAKAVGERHQVCRHRYDHIDLPSIRPVVTRVELFGGRCPACRRRFRAQAPADHPVGTPFGPGIQALLTYLHHSHHVSFERLARMLKELFGLKISEGAIANAFRRLQTSLTAACAAIKTRIMQAAVIASDETTARVEGKTHWQWVFVTDTAVLHDIKPSRARAVVTSVLGLHRPEVWISDRYAGQQDLGQVHQVCLAHVLRDVQYAIDCGDTVFAPRIRDLLRWTIRIGKRKPRLKDTTLATYAGRAEHRLDVLLSVPAAHPAGRTLQHQIKAWRGKFFVFLADRRVPSTNNICEREIRPSVVFRKVTNGFRSAWGAQIHAGYRSITGTARLSGASDYDAVCDLVREKFAPT